MAWSSISSTTLPYQFSLMLLSSPATLGQRCGNDDSSFSLESCLTFFLSSLLYSHCRGHYDATLCILHTLAVYISNIISSLFERFQPRCAPPPSSRPWDASFSRD